MKQKIQFLLVIIALVFSGCSSDGNKMNNKDSIITDTGVMDTADMKAAPADTTVMRID